VGPSVFQRYFKVDPTRVTLEQARELATRYPVFREEGTLTRHPHL
jgi:hypothetical protein